jgi:glycosyltransferase involved in cell wall biosynthesis
MNNVNKMNDDSKLVSKRVVLITNIPTPYRIPLYNALFEECNKRGMKFTVVFASKGYKRRKWKIDFDKIKFPHHFLPSAKISFGGNGRVLFTYSNILKTLSWLSPDLIISAGFSIATIKIALYACQKQTPPYIIWTESIDRPFHHRSGLRMLQRRLLGRKASAFLVSGSRAAAYVKTLGVKPGRIFRAISTVDTDLFHQKTAQIRNALAETASGEKILLYVGHFTRGKRIDLLLYLLHKLLLADNSIELWLVGSGPEYHALNTLSRSLGIEKNVLFFPFQQQENLFDFYARADCFVFPSEYDVWGMALVEAMASGLPCLASKSAGAAIDLIEHGKNGFLVDFRCIDNLLPLLSELLNKPNQARRMGKKAADSIRENCHIRNSVSGFIEAMKWSIR